MSTPTLHTLIQHHDRSGADPEDVAVTVLKAIHVPSDAASLLLYLVAHEVRNLRRGEVRAVEHRVSRRKPLSAELAEQVVGHPLDLRAALLEGGLLEMSFWTPSHPEGIQWGIATVADHQERIDYLQTKIAGIAHTISLHSAAVDAITTAGVACLAELAGQPA